MGDWDPGSYLLFFIYGYLIFSNEKIQETITKYGTVYLVAASILTALYLDSHFGVHLRIPGVTRHDLLNNGALYPMDHSAWAAVEAFRGLLGWCWILGLLGLGRRLLNVENKFIGRSNEGVLPFYILHHSVIYVIGFYIIQWGSSVGIKFFHDLRRLVRDHCGDLRDCHQAHQSAAFPVRDEAGSIRIGNSFDGGLPG